MNEIVRISKENFVVTEWSGGSTTQLFIFPEGSDLAKRDFIWRISSATFTSTTSRFSDFSAYQRYLLPLKGELYLKHCDKYDTTLKPYDVEYFMGSWITDSTNSLDCRDFNLIVRKDVHCNLVVAKNPCFYIPKRNGTLCLFSLDEFELSVYCDKVESVKVLKEELFIIQEKEVLNKLHINSMKSPVIICEIGEV